MPLGSRLVLLSLDGGGVRGLSSIMVIEDIMKGINHGRSPDSQLKPYQVFDLMGGTSTGGLIAVMLGRLKMSAEECKQAYLRLSERIFRPKRAGTGLIHRGKDLWQAKGRFDSKELEDAIKETIEDCKIGSKEWFKEPDASCKVFVCAIPTGNAYTVALFRTYTNPMMPEDSYNNCYTWEACRATSAATTFFDPITIGPLKQTFADGAVAYNNPVQHVYREAQQLWPEMIGDALLITIGTGAAPGPSFEGNAVKVVAAMKKIVTQTEKTNNDFAHDHSEMLDNGRLYRFNVLHGLADVRLEEYKEITRITEATRIYLNDAELRSKYRKCVQSLKNALEEISASPTPNLPKVDQKSPEEPIQLSIVSDIIPIRTPHFVGRQSELENIEQVLRHDVRDRKTVVLYGLSGFGKTQLALKYWADSGSLYTSRIWIDATSLETAYESFRDILSKIGQNLPGNLVSGPQVSLSSSSKVVFSTVRRWLSDSENTGWLMVIDNIEDLDGQLHVQDLIPESDTGKILITTTQHDVLSIIDGEGMEVGKIDENAGAEILTHRFKTPPSSEDVKQLVRVVVTILQGVPLAIEQAGAYLSIYRTLTAELLHAFIRKLQSEYENVMSTIPKRSKWYYEKHRSIVDTFNLLKEALIGINQDSNNILNLSAFLAPGNIPISIFGADVFSPHPESDELSYIEIMAQKISQQPQLLKWTEHICRDSHLLHAAISTLEDYCCVRIRWNGEGTEMISFSIHNAVRVWCQESWQPDEKERQAILAAFYLSRSLTADAETFIANRQRYLRHVRSSENVLLQEEYLDCAQAPEGPLWSLAWSTSMSFGKFYQQQRYLSEAQYHFKKAIEYEKFAMDDQWPANTTSMKTLHLLALVYWQDGKLDEAIETYDTLFKTSQTVYGHDSELTLRLANELCRVRSRALDNTRDWSRIVLAVNHQKMYTPQIYPSPLAASQEAKPTEAEFDEEEYRLDQIVKESAQMFGEDAIETMNAKFELARFYALERQLEKAAPLAESAWRFRMLTWMGKDMPKSIYFLEPFCICLDGYLLSGKSISELIQEYPLVLHHAITVRYETLIDTIFRDGVLPAEVLSEMVSKVDNEGESPLYAAIGASGDENYFAKLIERLLANGADMSYQTTRGNPLLHEAVMYNQKIAVEKFLARGVDTDARALSTNASVLHYAVIQGNLEMIELLLNHGVRINASTTEGITALHLAVLLGNRRMVQLLIRHGANPNMQTQLGAGPVHMVVISPFFLVNLDKDLYHRITEDYIDKVEGQKTIFGNALLNVIREAFAILGSISYEWTMCYKYSSFFDHIKEQKTSGGLILKDLVDANAYIDLRCVNLSTPLHLILAAVADAPHFVEAAKDDFGDMLQEFIKHGADLLARDSRGTVAASILQSLQGSLQAKTDSEGSETLAISQTDLRGRNKTTTSVTKSIESMAKEGQSVPAEDSPEYHSDLDEAEPILSTSLTNSETLFINLLDDEEDTPLVDFPALTQTGVGSSLLASSQQSLKPGGFDDLYDVSD